MATQKRFWVSHTFEGGWSSNLGTFTVVPANRASPISFLTEAENIVYELDGGFRKSHGTAKLNSAALESGATVTGIYDFWSGAGVQKRIIHVGTTCKKDDADGTFTNIFTGLTLNAVPNYSQLDDLVIIASDAAADTPKSYDGSTAQALAGTPPNFSFSTVHQGRVWASGVAANPSRIYFSTYLNPEGWSGTGSGWIDIDPNDGDAVKGMISHNGDLFVFKGPYKGSIHRITGDAPTGSSPFAHRIFIRGVGAVSQNAIFRFSNDIGFLWSDGMVHSLASVAAYGEFKERALSFPIHEWVRDHVNFSALNKAWSVLSCDCGWVLIAVPIDGGTAPNQVLLMDYRFEPFRWAKWTDAYKIRSMTEVVDPADSNRQIIMAGCSDGFVRKLYQPVRSIDDAGYPMRVTTPFIDYGATPEILKALTAVGLTTIPKSDKPVAFRYARDTHPQQQIDISQGGSHYLAPTDGTPFILDTSTLGAASHQRTFSDVIEGGEFRDIQYEFRNEEAEGDLRIQAFSVQIEGGSMGSGPHL